MVGVRSDCNKHIPHRVHYTRKKNQWKPKHPFDSKDAAQDYIVHYKRIGYKAYVCPICGKWHIGFEK